MRHYPTHEEQPSPIHMTHLLLTAHEVAGSPPPQVSKEREGISPHIVHGAALLMMEKDIDNKQTTR